MPVNYNDAGSQREAVPYVNQSGTAVECAVYENQNGEAVLIHSPIPRIDSFEDGDIAEYSGATGAYQVEDWSGSSPAPIDGDMVLSRGSDGGMDNIYSTSGLDNYPSRGDSFRVWYYVADAAYDEYYVTFVTQNQVSASVPDGYTVGVVPINDSFTLEKDHTIEDSVGVSYSQGWYYANVTFDDDGSGDVIAVLYDDTGTQLGKVYHRDTAYDTGGVAFATYARAGAAFDHAYLHNVVETAPPDSDRYAISTGVTQNNADADGSQTNEWTASLTFDGDAAVNEAVSVASGYDEDILGGIAAGDSKTTDSNGEAAFTATADSAGDYTVGLEHADAGVDTATATYQEPITVLDDVEWGGTDTVADHYDDDTSDYSVTSSTVLEGSYSIQADTAFAEIGHVGTTLSDRSAAYTYACRVRAGASSGRPGFIVHAQEDYDAMLNCYYVFLYQDQDELELRKRYYDGSTNTQTLADTAVSLSADTTYDLRFSGDGSGAITAAVHTPDGDTYGTELASVTATDTEYTGGTFGFHTASDAPCYYDYVRKES